MSHPFFGNNKESWTWPDSQEIVLYTQHYIILCFFWNIKQRPNKSVCLCKSKRGKEIMANRKRYMFWSDNGGQMPTKEVGTYVLRTFCVRTDMVFCHTNLSCLSQQNAIYRQGSKN